jgi:glycosyltransferase involved in cell wall biosynthesis
MMGSTLFWRCARTAGLRIAHTVHNVLPHERAPRDLERMRPVYSAAAVLIVHSEQARKDFERTFPSLAARVMVQHHGAYTCYPPASADRALVRARLDVAASAIVLLAFGWVRPYKNIESLIRALADPSTQPVTLVIAGQEGGYPEPPPRAEDPLGRMRALAEELGVAHRVRFLPRFMDTPDTSDLLSAADIVALPYLECSGSGQLLLAMTMGRYVLATAAGGMDEYLAHYPAHTLLRGTGAADVITGLRDAVERLACVGDGERRVPGAFAWPHIAANTVRALEVMRPSNLRRAHR